MDSQQQPNLDQRLDAVEHLPTGFFPSPETTPTHEKKSRVVVIAYDHSNYGDAMIAKAINLQLVSASDDIRILHIVSQHDYSTLFAPMVSGSGTSASGNLEADSNVMESVADAMIWEIINSLRKHGFNHVSSEILRGDPKESIVDYCRMSKPAYLITGTRGLGAVKRAVMGSVSNFLTHHCPCPVLILKLEPIEIEARKSLNDKKQVAFNEVLAKFTNA